MNEDSITEYFLSKLATTKDFPFGSEVAVFKVKGKMFGTFSIHQDKPAINLKCDPDEAAALRDIFESVIPGYHMNKRLWNTVFLDGTVPKGEIERMIDNSYLLVVAKMTKKAQKGLI